MAWKLVVRGDWRLLVRTENIFEQPEVLEVEPRLHVVEESGDVVKGVTARLYMHSLNRPGTREMPAALHNHITVDPPEPIVGTSAQPPWLPTPVVLESGRELDLKPFSETELGLAGRAYLFSVPNTLGPGVPGGLTEEERARQRGSLLGLRIFGAAIHVYDGDGMSDWYQFVAAHGPRHVPRTSDRDPLYIAAEIRTLAVHERPRVFWEAQWDYGLPAG